MPKWKRYRFRKRIREMLNLEGKVIFLPSIVENNEPIELTSEELLALKLKDLENKTLDEIGLVLEISRVKASELIRKAREKIVKALIEKRPLIISEE